MSFSELYLSGISRQELARRYGKTYEDITDSLIDEFFFINDQRIEFQAGRSYNWKETQAALGLPYSPTFGRENPQLKVRPVSSRNPKNHTKHDSFRFMEREGSAFWAGWIYGDKQTEFGIDFDVTVERPQKEQLEKFRLFTVTPSRLLLAAERTMPPFNIIDYKLEVRSLPMSRDMFRLGRGVVIEQPHGIVPESVRHFLRGYIERYGTLRTSPDSALVIPGSAEFLRWVEKNGPGGTKLSYHRDTEVLLSHSRDTVSRWHDYLYFDAKVTSYE